MLSERKRPPKTTNIESILKAVEEEKKFKYHVPIRGIIPAPNVALVIGPGGSTLSAIAKSCDALISLSESRLRNRFRIFTVHGQPRNCANAWTTYLQKCTQFPPNTQHYVDFIFPDEYITFAENEGIFQEIANKSKVNIRITNECLPESTERIVKISIQGKDQLEYFYTAVKLLAQHAIQSLRILMALPDTMFYAKTDELNDEQQVKCLSESRNITFYNPAD